MGNNCIGKQVFRRKSVEMNKLTMEQLKRSRDELTELERKFLDRVSQTSRCKPGVMPKLGALTQADKQDMPWMQPPANYSPSPSSRAGVSAGRSMLDAPASSNPNNPLDQNLTLSQIRQPSANGGGRTTSFEALMSLDFESMQSMENLNNLNGGVKVKEPRKPSAQANWTSAGGAAAVAVQNPQNVQQQQQQQQIIMMQHVQAQGGGRPPSLPSPCRSPA